MYTFILQKEPDEKGQWSVIKIRCPSTMGVRAGGGTQYLFWYSPSPHRHSHAFPSKSDV